MYPSHKLDTSRIRSEYLMANHDDESPRSLTDFKIAIRKKHDSCPSLSTFQNFADAMADQTVKSKCDVDEQAAALFEKWLEERNIENEADFNLDRAAQVLPGFDQFGSASSSSILSDDGGVFDSLVVTRRRRGNFFDTAESESSFEDEDSDNAPQPNDEN